MCHAPSPRVHLISFTLFVGCWLVVFLRLPRGGAGVKAWELFFPILLSLDPAKKAKPAGRTDLVTKAMADSWMPEDEGLADRCYYIPGKCISTI